MGSVSADNTGRAGIELEYDQYLAGVSGRWKKNTDLLGNELVEGAEEYHEAQDGYNVVLSLDEAIQYYVEKALEKGMEKTKAKRIMCLVMNPKTGEILASATTPGYDPNEPMDSKNVPKAQSKAYKKMSADEKQSYLISLWRNPIVSDTYRAGLDFQAPDFLIGARGKGHQHQHDLPMQRQLYRCGCQTALLDQRQSRHADDSAGNRKFLQSGLG